MLLPNSDMLVDIVDWLPERREDWVKGVDVGDMRSRVNVGVEYMLDTATVP
jgi:hypothetical protein